MLKVIWEHLYSQENAVDVGTLFNASSILENSQIGEDPFRDFYGSSYLVDKFTVAYIISGALTRFGMSNIDVNTIKENEPDEGHITYDFLKSQAKQFVDEFVQLKHYDVEADAPRSLNLVCQYCYKKFKCRITALSKHEVKMHGHCLLQEEASDVTCTADPIFNYTCVALTLGLIRWEHNDAISLADGERLLLVQKFLTLIYKVSNCPKYAHAMLETQCQAMILLSPRDAYLFKWNRFVNHQGRKNSNYPNDQDMEHLNLIFKTEVKTYRGKFTEKTLESVSKSAEATNEIAKNYDQTTKVFFSHDLLVPQVKNPVQTELFVRYLSDEA